MAASGGSRGGAPRRPARVTRPTNGKAGRGGAPRKATAKKTTPSRGVTPGPAGAPMLPPGPFRLGAVEGATPGKWIDTWKARHPGIPLDLTPLGLDDQHEALVDHAVDAAIVRLPIDRTGLHVIPLYDEVPVVVCAADSHLTAAEELTLADLADEIVIVPRQAPLHIEVPGSVSPRFAPPGSVGEAIATVAAGVGVVIVPMSLARLHHRKDVAHRPLVDGPASPVALAWAAGADGETPTLVDAFVGIVRGRTANSSR